VSLADQVTILSQQVDDAQIDWATTAGNGIHYLDTGDQGLYVRLPNGSIAFDTKPSGIIYHSQVTMNQPLVVDSLYTLGVVSAESFQSEKFRFIATDISMHLERFDDEGESPTNTWVRFVTFNWGGDSGSILTNNIRALGALSVAVNDNLVVNGNLNVTGDITYGGIVKSPFWVAGVIDLANLNILNTSGQVEFTVTRAAGYSTGIVKIQFASAHPRGDSNFLVQLSSSDSGFIKLWGSQPPTPQNFHLAAFNVGNGLSNPTIHFVVVA
jgi:hypothetical protein